MSYPKPDLTPTPRNSRIWLEIDTKAIRNNFRMIAGTVSPAEVMVVLKADAYGLGMSPIAESLLRAGASRLGVAEVREAVALREITSRPIHILGALIPEEVPPALDHGIIVPIHSVESAREYSRVAQSKKITAKAHILIDTGMGRLGIPHESAKDVLPEIFALPALDIEGVYSHLANANMPEDPKTLEQLEAFQSLLQKLPRPVKYVHLANSDGINNFTQTYFDMVRTGINLYGVFDLMGHHAYTLNPTLSLKSRLIARRRLKRGRTIGYGAAYSLPRDTWVGTVPAGYADGIPYHLRGKPEVLMDGRRYPVIGRVSMDYITLDLGEEGLPQIGDTVVIFGCSGKDEITVEDWARLKQSHPYDIICSLGRRVDRVYL